jgi:hypothetical protein
MLDRRRFLIATLALAALPPLARAARQRDDDGLWVVVDGACSDVRHFSAQCTATTGSACDAVQVMTTLAASEVRHCFGLGRDSQFFLIEQMAGELGYRLGYQGRHAYRDGTLLHQLIGAQGVLDTLAPQLRSAGAAWAVPLARTLPALVSDTSRSAEFELKLAAARPPDSGGYLVSWCLHRV